MKKASKKEWLDAFLKFKQSKHQFLSKSSLLKQFVLVKYQV